jgi:AraC family transcriptional regulator
MLDAIRTPQALRAEYVARINRVIDHVERNLDQPLSLAALADVAQLSRFHFHRIFGAMVGETLHGFVQRLRVERAAVMLVANPRTSITEIALDCGFSSSATFARAFKEAFGMSGTQWRARPHLENCDSNRKIRKALGNPRKAEGLSACYFDPRTATPTWRYEMSTDRNKLTATIEVKDLPEHNVAYLRHVGPYGQVALVPRLVDELREWAVPRGLLTSDTRLLLVPHDQPNITEQDKLRLSICLTVPAGTAVEGEVGTMKIPGGKFAVGHFEITPDRIAEAWNVVCGDWLPQSGYQPDDRLSYEEARNDPRQHPQGKIIVDVCVPVRPL